MVGYFLVVEMPHARDKGRMAVLPGPVDRFFLRLKGAEHVVCVILHHKVFNRAIDASCGEVVPATAYPPIPMIRRTGHVSGTVLRAARLRLLEQLCDVGRTVIIPPKGAPANRLG